MLDTLITGFFLGICEVLHGITEARECLITLLPLIGSRVQGLGLRDHNRDPNIKALKRRGFINQGST